MSRGLSASFRVPGARFRFARPTGSDRYHHSVEISALRRPRSGRVKFEGEALVTGSPPPLALIAPVVGGGSAGGALASVLPRDGVNVTQKSVGLLASGRLEIGRRRVPARRRRGGPRLDPRLPGPPHQLALGDGLRPARGRHAARLQPGGGVQRRGRGERGRERALPRRPAGAGGSGDLPLQLGRPARPLADRDRRTARCRSPSDRCTRTGTCATCSCCGAASCSLLASLPGS